MQTRDDRKQNIQSIYWVIFLFEIVILSELADQGIIHTARLENQLFAQEDSSQLVFPLIWTKINDTICYKMDDSYATGCYGIKDCSESMCRMTIDYQHDSPFVGLWLPMLTRDNYTLDECKADWEPITLKRLLQDSYSTGAIVLWFISVFMLILWLGLSIYVSKNGNILNNILYNSWIFVGILQNICALISFILVGRIEITEPDVKWLIPSTLIVNYIVMVAIGLLIIWYIWMSDIIGKIYRRRNMQKYQHLDNYLN